MDAINNSGTHDLGRAYLSDAALIPYNPLPVVKADNDDTIVDLWLRTKRNPGTRSLYAYTVTGFRGNSK